MFCVALYTWSLFFGPCGNRPDIVIFLVVNAVHSAIEVAQNIVEWMGQGLNKSIISTSVHSSVFDNDTQGQVIKEHGFIFD